MILAGQPGSWPASGLLQRSRCGTLPYTTHDNLIIEAGSSATYLELSNDTHVLLVALLLATCLEQHPISLESLHYRQHAAANQTGPEQVWLGDYRHAKRM